MLPLGALCGACAQQLEIDTLVCGFSLASIFGGSAISFMKEFSSVDSVRFLVSAPSGNFV